ncbi:MAG: right-handed parallel beta-helix repeat-containing protein, partial [bacterium]|nr:right-handed parallel beta-helix repeat-containing protein [bacterium]
MLRRRLIRVAIGIAAPGLFFPTHSVAALINVPAGTSVQAAIDVARAGDTVALCPGLYVENVYMRPSVALLGPGPDKTTISALRFGPVVVASQGTRIAGLTIADGETGLYVSYDQGPNVENCAFAGNGTGLVLNTCQDAKIRRCTFTGNWRGVSVDASDGEIDQCDLHGNFFGLGSFTGAAPRITRCWIASNVVGLDTFDSDPLVTNSTFRGNGTALRSAAHSNPRLLNCTLWLNTYTLRTWDEHPTAITLSNSIIWDSGGPSVDLHFGPLGSVAISYSNVEGGWPGEGNIDQDPQFRDPFSLDFRLQPTSPCIDAGDNNATGLPEMDIAGVRRIMFGGKSFTVDMGAYEFYINKLEPVPGTNEAIFTWSSLEDRTYSVFYTDDLFTWHTAIAAFPSSGNQTTSWLDDG